MAWTTRQISFAVAMVITGSLNTLSTKWADNCNAESSDGEQRTFNHPFLQAVGMFLGEMSCLLAFHLIRLYHHYKKQQMDIGNQSFSPLIFLPAACCDMVGTSLMYIGLNLTYASSFQMLRGLVRWMDQLEEPELGGHDQQCNSEPISTNSVSVT